MSSHTYVNSQYKSTVTNSGAPQQSPSLLLFISTTMEHLTPKPSTNNPIQWKASMWENVPLMCLRKVCTSNGIRVSGSFQFLYQQLQSSSSISIPVCCLSLYFYLIPLQNLRHSPMLGYLESLWVGNSLEHCTEDKYRFTHPHSWILIRNEWLPRPYSPLIAIWGRTNVHEGWSNVLEKVLVLGSGALSFF